MNTIPVGPTQSIKTLFDGVAKASAGDTLVLDGGTYTCGPKAAVISKPLTIQSRAGTRALLVYDGTGIPGPKCIGISNPAAAPVILNNLDFYSKGLGWAIMCENAHGPVTLNGCS